MPADPGIVFLAILAEQVTGRPALWRGRVTHPVAWIARAIGALERRLNRPDLDDRARRRGGILTLVATAGGAGLIGFGLDRLFALSEFGVIPAAFVGALGLALHSLYVHVAEVQRTLADGDLSAAQVAVGMIVGRDTGELDEAGIAAAALESLAESFNDGVVAPLFWFLLGGLAGLFVYKAVNTADSLIGHKEAPYRDFGWAAARMDDVMNLIPARLAGALIVLAGGRGWRTMWRDAPRHASPNAGWPEAAMAGALATRLGGPAAYDGLVHERPVFGDGPLPGMAELKRGLRIYLWACGILVLLIALAGAGWPR